MMATGRMAPMQWTSRSSSPLECPAGTARRQAVAAAGAWAFVLAGTAAAPAWSQVAAPTASATAASQPAGSGLRAPPAGEASAIRPGAWPSRFVPDDFARAAGLRESSVWSLQFSPGTWHANPSPDHAHSAAIGLRRALGPTTFLVGSLFSNSFGQPSAYAGYGQRLYGGVPGQPKFYVEWTAGLIYGYVRDRADEVPLNVKGLSPAFTLSPGWQFTPQLSAQLNVIGTVAVMLQLDWRFD